MYERCNLMKHDNRTRRIWFALSGNFSKTRKKKEGPLIMTLGLLPYYPCGHEAHWMFWMLMGMTGRTVDYEEHTWYALLCTW